MIDLRCVVCKVFMDQKVHPDTVKDQSVYCSASCYRFDAENRVIDLQRIRYIKKYWL